MGKLVRDRIPEIIREAGGAPDVRVLPDGEYLRSLHDKLGEEAGELASATGGEVLGELADILEVLRALAGVHGVAWAEVERAAEAKRAARGGFEARLYLS